MSLIIETDLGGDPDDLFAILFLLAAGAEIDAVVLSPGTPDQVALAEFIKDQGCADFRIGVARKDRPAKPSSKFYTELLTKYGYPLTSACNDYGTDVMINVWTDKSEFLAIGPLSNYKGFYTVAGKPFVRATMQGGFCPYSLYWPQEPVEKFLGKSHCQTYNLNGDIDGAGMFLAAPFPRQMVGKNVCHSIIFSEFQIGNFRSALNPAAALFLDAAIIMSKEKKFHDPVAAALHLCPMIGTWIKGHAVRTKEGWTTVPGGDDSILVDIDRELFWEYMYGWGNLTS